MLEDFVPWPEVTTFLHFNIVAADGHVTTARVSRECLTDHRLLNPSLTREQFAAGPVAEKLKRLAEAKLARGEQPVITSDDWV